MLLAEAPTATPLANQIVIRAVDIFCGTEKPTAIYTFCMSIFFKI